MDEQMSQKLLVNGFMCYNGYLSDFNEDFIKNYDENSDERYFLEVDIEYERYFLEVDIEYPKKLWSSHRELPFFTKEKKIWKSRTTSL